jgi:cytosine/adenosine deaminase-related metal-dependent hydrolase
MKRFSAQYIITNTGPLLKRAIVNAEDDGTIISIEETKGDLAEKQNVEFYNGIIVPGFVNCHCHLELSHMKGAIAEGGGLGFFIEQVRGTREDSKENISTSLYRADNEMYRAGIVLCADICNTSDTFNLKKESRIKYLNLLEVFGIDPDKARRRIDEISDVAKTAEKMKMSYSFVPHSTYSMSLSLLRLLKEITKNNKVTSIHFLETPAEKSFLADHSGALILSYIRSGLLPARLDTVKSHADAVLNEITQSGNLILVHNTFADRETISLVKKRGNIYWCLCPNSNYYIEKELAPVNLLLEEGCEIVIGTDSLASNTKLDVLSELITLQAHFPSLALEDLVAWGTINGARALGADNDFGKIEPGKRPGLLVLQNVDLVNMKLLPDSYVTRLF